MARKKKEQMAAPGAPAWMATYGDMITLVLTFFVLLFSMSSLDLEKFKAMVTTFNGNPDIFYVVENRHNIGDTGLKAAPDIPDDWLSEPTDEWFMAAYQMLGEIEKFMEGQQGNPESGNEDLSITLDVTEATIRIIIQGEVLFDTLSDELKPYGVLLLDEIMQMDKGVMEFWRTGLIDTIHVEGHADSRQIPPGSRFTNNLILSAFRAIAAHQYIMGNYDIPPDKIGSTGWGDTHPLEREPDESDARWWERNRRVELILHRDFLFDEQTGEGYERAA